MRSQQRGIPPLVIDYVVNYGRQIRRKGANVYFVDKKSRKALKMDIGSVAYDRLDDLFGAYVVVTTARRCKRLLED